jgi:hypothetical protein
MDNIKLINKENNQIILKPNGINDIKDIKDTLNGLPKNNFYNIVFDTTDGDFIIKDNNSFDLVKITDKYKIKDIVYGSGLLIAVCSTGEILRSYVETLSTWEVVLKTDSCWESVISVPGSWSFMAVASSGTYRTATTNSNYAHYWQLNNFSKPFLVSVALSTSTPADFNLAVLLSLCSSFSPFPIIASNILVTSILAS